MTTKPVAKNAKRLYIIKRLVISFFALWLITFIAIWALSPSIAKWQINKQLAPYQLRLADDSSIRLNPFLLQLRLNSIELNRIQGSTKLAAIDQALIDIKLWPLLANRIEIEEFSLSGFHLDSKRTDSDLEVAGFSLSQNTNVQASNSNHLLAKDELGSIETTLENQAAQNEITAEEIKTDQPWQILSSQLNLTKLNFYFSNQGQNHLVSLHSINITDTSISTDNLSTHINIIGQVEQSPLQLSINLASSGDVTTIYFNLQLDDFLLNNISYLMPAEVSSIGGQISLNVESSIVFKDNALAFDSTKTRINLKQFSARLNDLVLSNENTELDLTNIQLVQQENQAPKVYLKFKINNTNTQVIRDNQNPTQTSNNLSDILISFDALIFNNGQLSINDGNIASLMIEQLTIEQLKASELNTQSLAPLATFKSFNVDQINFAGNHLSINEITLDTLNSQVILDSSKNLANLISLSQNDDQANLPPLTPIKKQSATQQELNTETKIKQSSPTYSMQLNQFNLVGASSVIFEDNSVKPKFNQQFNFEQFFVGALDSRQPNQITPFNLTFKTDAFAKTEISGEAQFFNPKLNFKTQSKSREFSLPKVSPYLSKAIGFDMLNGQFDTDIRLNIVDDIIQGDANLAIRGLELSDADQEQNDASALIGASSMSLNTAMNLLKDDKGNLSLDIPLSGNINSPQFGVSKFIALITKKAVMSATQSYLVDTFIPYSNVLSVVMMAGDYLLKVNIENLNYSPAQTHISLEQEIFMQEFKALMTDKAGTQIKICAIATTADLNDEDKKLTQAEQKQKLTLISETRGQEFKTWMVSNGQINSSRLLLCKTKVDYTKNAKPRIEFEV
jgi:hypothetical protein